MTVSSQVKQTLSSLRNIKGTLNVYIKQTNNEETKKIYGQAMEKSYADLINFSIETQNEDAKKMYVYNAEEIKKIKDDLEPYLLR